MIDPAIIDRRFRSHLFENFLAKLRSLSSADSSVQQSCQAKLLVSGESNEEDFAMTWAGNESGEEIFAGWPYATYDQEYAGRS